MKTTPNTPQWATDLVIQVCKDYKRTLPRILTWENTEHLKSSGWCSYMKSKDKNRYQRKYFRIYADYKKFQDRHQQIKIKAGYDLQDQRLVLLHELAHWVKMQKHTRRFWETAFLFYEQYGVEIGQPVMPFLEYAFDREKHYRQMATTVYRERIGE